MWTAAARTSTVLVKADLNAFEATALKTESEPAGHRIVARWRLLLNVKGHSWAACAEGGH
jgi:hypothetical protein